jgi:transposase
MVLAFSVQIVYDLNMASIISKNVNGGVYYYLRQMHRVDGKPKMAWERYLGKASDIESAMAGAVAMPARTRHLAFGDVAAVWSMLERIGVADIIDDVVGPRRDDAAASVGTYVALAAMNRVVAPCSKLAFGDWWTTTAADRFVPLASGATDHRRFWDAMDVIDTDSLVEIERRVSTKVVDEFDLDLSGLALDMTNFATYIDSANDAAPIAQRGHAKQKRVDLRLVGLGLVVTTDGAVPLVSHAYPGNRPDVTQFAGIVAELSTRWSQIADTADLTVVYDAGQNSAANQQVIENTALGFVGSLPPSDHPDLMAIPDRQFRTVDADRYPGLKAVDTRARGLGAERRVIVTHSPTLHAKQSAGFDQTLAKASQQLDELAGRLARGKTRRPRDKVEADIARICKDSWIKRVIDWTLTGTTPTTMRLTYKIDTGARQLLETELFGKRVLFTSRQDWPVVDVIAAYRSQHHVESDFRQLKDRRVVSFNPMHHWTDQKIRVHVFYCVLALTITKLMARQADQAGHHLSVRALLDHLAGIGETVLIYPSTGGRPKARRVLTDMNTTQRDLYNLFNLDTYAPKR